MGNTDEMLHRSEFLPEFSAPHLELAPMFAKVAEMAAWTRTQLGSDRLEWLRAQPGIEHQEDLALVRASPGDIWRAPRQDAADAALFATYGPLSRPVVVYGHIHVPFVRKLGGLTVANSGSVGQSHDGDPRALAGGPPGGTVIPGPGCPPVCGQEPGQVMASMARVSGPLPWLVTCMPIAWTLGTEGTTQVRVNQPRWDGTGTPSATSSE